MAWVLLGDEIELELLRSPQVWTEKTAVEMAELPVIGHRSYLHNVGPKLDEISLEALLHARDGDPGLLLDSLTEKREAGEVLSVSLGDGSYLGDFVLTDTTWEPKATFSNGTTYQGILKLQLKEWIEDADLRVSQRTKPAIKSPTAKKVDRTTHTQDEDTGHIKKAGS